MSRNNQNTLVRDTRLFSRTTISMSPIFLSGNQALHHISLLSPLEEQTKTGHQQYNTLLTIDTYSCASLPHTDAKMPYEEQTESPEDRDCYYDQENFYSPALPYPVDSSKLPPIPTYNESQMAYHPNGVKRLPHFHPQKFSKRLRTIINQRRRPQPLSLYIEPQPKSYFSPSSTPSETSSSPVSLIQSILRVFPQGYSHADEVENGIEEYDEEKGFWGNLDHRVIILGLVGLILLAFGLGAWVMALYSA